MHGLIEEGVEDEELTRQEKKRRGEAEAEFADLGRHRVNKLLAAVVLALQTCFVSVRARKILLSATRSAHSSCSTLRQIWSQPAGHRLASSSSSRTLAAQLLIVIVVLYCTVLA